MEDSLKSIAADMIVLLQSGKDLVIEQFPILVQQLITWNLIMDIIGSIVFIFILCVCVYFIKNSNSKDSKYYDYNDVIMPVSIFTGVTSISITLFFIVEMIKIIFVPNLFLLQYFMNMVK